MTALTFRPWAAIGRNAEQDPLQDVLARVNLERGHFRDITEASLLEEIAARPNDDASDSDDGDDDDDGGRDGDVGDDERNHEKVKTREELFKAKFEMLQHVQAANNDVMIALDYISLLQSKDAPTQAVNTISPNLKSSVPLGSIGIDLWRRMPIDTIRDAQDDSLAINVRIDALQQSADTLVNAAARLHESVRKETKYWEQVLSITDQGWNVCRLPGAAHRLGVTYGFNESSPEFSRRGVAALTTDADGALLLKHGIGSKPQTLRVTVKRGRKVLGVSDMSRPSQLGDVDSKHLEDRIRLARDSLLDEELYREMIRESRSMSSLGVELQDSGIVMRSLGRPASAVELVFELVACESTLEESDAFGSASGSSDPFASAVLLSARLLLLQAHRTRLQKRTEVPPPLSNRKEERPIVPVLRPILAFTMHLTALEQLNPYLDSVQALLSNAHVDSTMTRARFSPARFTVASDASALASAMLQPWTSSAKLTIDDASANSFTIALQIETTLISGLGPVYVLTDPSEQQYRLNSIDNLRMAFDRVLASSLANALCSSTLGEWQCDAREATIHGRGEDGVASNVTVVMNSETRTLTMLVNDKTLEWTIGQSSPDVGFWAAWKEAS